VRWYASNQLLPSGTRQIIVGGRDGPNYEFCPKRYAGEGSFYVPILGGADKLYPYVCLLPNGNVFFFAGRQSVQINWNTQKTVDVPGDPRAGPELPVGGVVDGAAVVVDERVQLCGDHGVRGFWVVGDRERGHV
jgi:hypothetical protein